MQAGVEKPAKAEAGKDGGNGGDGAASDATPQTAGSPAAEGVSVCSAGWQQPRQA